MLTETHVRAAVVRWLHRHGYGYVDPKEKGEHGPDIRAKHVGYGRCFIVEAKGDPRKSKFPDSARTAYLWMIVGQIATRMQFFQTRYHHYGLALPASYIKKVKNIPWQFCKRTNLSIFLVDARRKVKRLTWKELRSLQGAARSVAFST